jgi:hypothetical protein
VLVRTADIVPIRVHNPYPHAVTLRKSTHVGRAQEADCTADNELVLTADGGPPDDGLPFDKVDLSHLSGEELEQAQRVFRAHHKVIARHDDDVRLTKLLKNDIELLPGTKPQADAQRTMPLHKREIAEEVISKMERQGIIEETVSAWRAFPVLVEKKDALSGEWLKNARFCLDFRNLNRHTVPHSRLLPKVHECIDALTGSVYFTKIDLMSSYNQVELTDRSKPMTAFCCPGGRQMQFRRMTFGLRNAGSSFCSLIQSDP